MKKRIIFSIGAGILSCIIATLTGFTIDQAGFWVISLSIISLLSFIQKWYEQDITL
jgi:hypothetical protein